MPIKGTLHVAVVVWALGQGQASVASEPSAKPPIIDMHLHAGPEPWLTGSKDAILAAMVRHNIVLGVVSGPPEYLEAWQSAAPKGIRLIAAPMFPCPGTNAPNGGPQCFPDGQPFPQIDWLRQQYKSGRMGAMGEITAQYAGMPPADPALEPYFALAEELDIPVGIHMSLAPPGTPYACCPRFRVALGNPLLLEEVLIKHPRLRIYIMHGGHPWTEETIGLMYIYPQVYADVSAINHPDKQPRAEFHEYLARMFKAGFGKRLMYGSDFGFVFDKTIESIQSAPFLTEEQKRDILYNNAARFLRLEKAGVK